jgi:hypothetical protein
MTPIQELQERIRRYLLGQLSDGAGEEMERDLLANEEIFAELLIIEDELTDEYVNGGLTPDERANFERHFLATPERHEDLRFAQALKRHVATAARNRKVGTVAVPSFWSTRSFLFKAAAAVAVVIIVAYGWFIFRPRVPQSLATINLTLGASERSEGTQAAAVPHDVGGLKIVLRLPDQSVTAVRYRVEVEHESGQKNSFAAVQLDKQLISVVVPGSELKPGQNSVKAFAIQADGKEQPIPGNCFFTVE